MICNVCKKYFTSGHRPDGTPNGVAFVLKNEGKITMCAECLINLGKMSEQEKDDFFRRMKEINKGN